MNLPNPLIILTLSLWATGCASLPQPKAPPAAVDSSGPSAPPTDAPPAESALNQATDPNADPSQLEPPSDIPPEAPPEPTPIITPEALAAACIDGPILNCDTLLTALAAAPNPHIPPSLLDAAHQRLAGWQQLDPHAIGVILPLSGPQAPIGEAAQEALLFALAQFESTYGLRFTLHFRDSEAQASQALRAAQALLEEEQVALWIGPIGQQENALLPAFAAEKAIPHLTLTSQLSAPSHRDLINSTPEPSDTPALPDTPEPSDTPALPDTPELSDTLNTPASPPADQPNPAPTEPAPPEANPQPAPTEPAPHVTPPDPIEHDPHLTAPYPAPPVTTLRMRTSAQELNAATARHAQLALGARRLAVLFTDSPRDIAAAEAFVAESERLGAEIVIQHQLDPEALRDLPKILGTPGRRQPATHAFDALFIAADPMTTRRLLPILDFAGLRLRKIPNDARHIQLLGPPSWNHQQAIDPSEGLSDNAIFASSFSPQDPSAQAFIRRFFLTHQRPPTAFQAEVYDTAMLAFHILKDALQPDPDGTAGRRQILSKAHQARFFEGATGLVQSLIGGKILPRAHLLTIDGDEIRPRYSEDEERSLRGIEAPGER